jgi:hypothetical protein
MIPAEVCLAAGATVTLRQDAPCGLGIQSARRRRDPSQSRSIEERIHGGFDAAAGTQSAPTGAIGCNGLVGDSDPD